MTIEQLKQKLADGELTQEQYQAELKNLLENESITQEEHDAATNYDGGDGGDGNRSNPDEGGNGGLTQEQVEKMIQSATDKIRTEKSQELKEKQKEIDELKKEKMTEEQRAEYERKQWEQEKAEKEKELQQREVALHTVDKLQEKQIPLKFKDFLAGESVEKTDENIESFGKVFQEELSKAVDERFKQQGGDPGANKKRGGSGAIDNPWKSETFNLTKQAQIMKDDPDLAKRLQAEAGK